MAGGLALVGDCIGVLKQAKNFWDFSKKNCGIWKFWFDFSSMFGVCVMLVLKPFVRFLWATIIASPVKSSKRHGESDTRHCLWKSDGYLTPVVDLSYGTRALRIGRRGSQYLWWWISGARAAYSSATRSGNAPTTIKKFIRYRCYNGLILPDVVYIWDGIGMWNLILE